VGFHLIVIGTSWGGLRALEALLSSLPPGFTVPIAIVQHRHKDSDDTLVSFLKKHCVLPVAEAEDKMLIQPGYVYLAPANYHLLVEVEHDADQYHCFSLSIEAPILHARPSIDVLFESAARVYANQVIGVVLTGASHDGAQGLAKIKACGGVVIVQDPTTAESPTMPQAAIAATSIDYILSLADIPPCLVKLCQPLPR
jgi:two-component system chemotaxis response regulator CheB